MPQANTYAAPSTTGGNREDLRDILTILEPEQTPVTSAISKGPSPAATLVEWVVDSLRTARVTGVPEGQDVSSFNNKASKRKRIGNYLQIIRDEYSVSDLQMQVAAAAIDDEFAWAKAKCVREMKRDIEAIVCSGADRQQGDNDTAWLTRGLFDWIDSAGPSDVPVDFRTPAANIAAYGAPHLEATLNGQLQALFEVQGSPHTYMLAAGTNLTKDVDNFTRVNSSTANIRYQVTEMASSHTITLSVKRFESTFGTCNVVPNVFLNPTAGTFTQNAGLILNLDLLELQFMDQLHSMELEDQAGGPRGYCKGIFALCVKNPRGLGKIG
jgi:hypothetical protein